MKKRIISIVLSLVMLLSLLPVTAFADTLPYAASGSGTSSDDPYIIMTLAQLEELADAVNGGTNMSGKYFKLGADIGSTDAPFTKMIGTDSSYPFSGKLFDGNGHTVTVKIDKTGSCFGLFAYVNNSASISNLTVAGTVKGTFEIGGQAYVGGVVGAMSGTLTNCCNQATVMGYATNGAVAVGGVGGGGNSIKLINCRNEGAVSGESTGSSYVGGLVGKLEYSSSAVSNSYNTGAVTNTGTTAGAAYIQAGGVTGFMMLGPSISNCYNTGAVTATTLNTANPVKTGGVVGAGSGSSKITNCYFDKTVNSTLNVAGDEANITFTTCSDLTTTQMQAAKGGSDALVDKLNGYRESEKYPDGWKKWEVSSGAYPTFEGPHAHDDIGEFQPWIPSEHSGALLPNTAGNWYLDEDVTLTSGWVLPVYGASSPFIINLCLNGHVLNLNGKSIGVNGGATLNIYDCDARSEEADYTHAGYVDANGLWHLGSGSGTTTNIVGGVITGGSINVANGAGIGTGGVFTMNGGTIAGNSNSYGGGVSVSVCGAFTMNGGTICWNTASRNGGGVYVTDSTATFTMTGGVISDNTAFAGGGVYVSKATFTMNDGTISRNTTTGMDYDTGGGGGVLVNDSGSFTMKKGTISNNTTKTGDWDSVGGGVRVQTSGSTFTMEGGTISGNSASGYGGGVWNGGTFKMIGGTISGNTAQGTEDNTGGGGVYTGGTFVMTGGTVTGNTATSIKGGGVYTDGETTFGGTARVTGNTTDNCYRSGGTIKLGAGGVVAEPANGMLIGANVGGAGYAFVSNNAYVDDDAKYFFSDNPLWYVHRSSADNSIRLDELSDLHAVKATLTDHGVVYAEPQAAAENTEITLTVVPDEGFELESLSVSGVDNTNITDNHDSTYTFTMPNENTTVTASFVESGPTIKVVKAKDAQSGEEVKNPIYGTAYSGTLFEVTTPRFDPKPALTLQWLNTSTSPATWSDSAPADGLTLNKDTGAVTTTTETPAGNYVFRITNGVDEYILDAPNSAFVASKPVTLTVEKKTPTVNTWPTTTAFDYGTYATIGEVPLSGLTSVGGSFAWKTDIASTPATAAKSGEYAVIFTPTDTDNYNTVSNNVTVTINKATPYLSGVIAFPIYYGTELSKVTPMGNANNSFSGEPVEGTFAFTNGSTVPTVADSDNTYFEVTFTPTDQVNYNTSKTSIKLQVMSADYADVTTTASGNLRAKNGETVEITLPEIPDGASYGTPVVAEALKNNVNAKIEDSKLKLTVTAAIPAGTEPFKVTVPVTPDANHKSYNITVTVTPVYKTVVTITATGENFTYGDSGKTGYKDASAKAGEVEVSGLAATLVATYYQADGQTLTKTTDGASAEGKMPANAGTYKVTISVPESNPNYTGQSAEVEFTIFKKTVIVEVNDKTAYVGETAPTLGEDDYTVTGLVGSDKLSKKPTLAYESTPNMSKAGTVAIKASGASAGNNYTISYNDGTLTISSRPSSGGGSSTVTVPVSGNSSSVKISASVSGSSATVKAITDTELSKVSGGETVEIDLTTLKKDIDTAKIPTVTVEKIAEKDGMSVKMPVGTVTFDKSATQEIVNQANGKTIQLVVDDIKEVSLNAVQKEAVKKLDTALIIDAYLVSDGARLCSESKGGFGGGKATVTLPFEIKNNRSAANYSVFYVDDAGNLEKLAAKYDTELGAFVFDITHFSNYVVSFDENAMPFVDVPVNEYFYDAVKWAVENGITNGVDAVHFGPEIGVTRAQVVTFLWRAAGCPEPVGTSDKFTDLLADQYYIKAVAWAIEQGITKGITETTFEPETVCTRGQIVTFLARFAGVEDADTESVFTDVPASEFFAAAVKWAKDNGVTSGVTETTFEPYTNCNRAQVVTFLYRWMVK